MSEASEHIKKQFPDKRMWFLKPRLLDEAILMVEEGVDPELEGHLRIVYQKERVMGLLYHKEKWPVNKILNYIAVAHWWAGKTKRSPIILDQGEIDDLLNGGEHECDGDCENCDSRHRPGE